MKSQSTEALLKQFAAILDELKDRGVTRTLNSPTGDYAEWLVAERLGLKLMNNSFSGYDAIAEDGTRYQIKCRRMVTEKDSCRLGIIRNLHKDDFDILIGILFNADFSVRAAYRIPREAIFDHARFSNVFANLKVDHLRGVRYSKS